MSFLNQLRPSNAAMTELMSWKTMDDGSMIATCRSGGYSDKILENLVDRRWGVASGVALIGVAIVIIVAIGSIWGGVAVGCIGLAIVAHRLLKRPDILTDLRVDPWLVGILHESGVKKLPIVRDLQSAKGCPIAIRHGKAFKTNWGVRYPGDKDITSYIFQYKVHKLDGEKMITEELGYLEEDYANGPEAYTSFSYEHQGSHMIRCKERSTSNCSKIAGQMALSEFGYEVAHPSAGDSNPVYQFVLDRITRLCRRDKLELLATGSDSNTDQYIQLIGLQ